MASLIEDLAKQLKKFKKECCDGEGQNKLGTAQVELDRLRRDLDRAKRQVNNLYIQLQFQVPTVLCTHLPALID